MSAIPSAAGRLSVAADDRAWRHVLPLWLAVLAWIGYWYRDTALAMWSEWTFSDTYAHGMLVAPITVWLVWRRRKELAEIAPRPSAWALAWLAGAALAWFLGDLVVVNAATQFSFVALIVLSVPAVLGVDVARALLFPLGFLFFGVPFGDFMLGPLMEGTADFTVAALRLSGVPVFREGLHFVIPSGSWSVVQECSGVRYLIASVMVGSLFAYLNYRSTRRRLIFVGVSILVPIVANWLRAFIIVMLGHLSNNKIATGVDHLIYGWVFFGFVIMVMFMIGMRWAEPDSPQPASAGRRASHGGALPATALWTSIVGTALVAVAPHVAQSALASLERSDTPRLAAITSPGDGWEALAPDQVDGLTDWKPLFENPAAESKQAFVRDGRTVGLYLAYYRQQNYGRKLVTGNNMLVHPRDKSWARASAGRRWVALGDGRFEVRTADLRGGALLQGGRGQRLHVWQVYWANERWVESDIWAKVHGALSRLMLRGDDSAAMLLYTPHEPGTDPGQVLQAFLAANLGRIEESLLATRDGFPPAPEAGRPVDVGHQP